MMKYAPQFPDAGFALPPPAGHTLNSGFSHARWTQETHVAVGFVNESQRTRNSPAIWPIIQRCWKNRIECSKVFNEGEKCQLQSAADNESFV